jgi:hypothetical protein
MLYPVPTNPGLVDRNAPPVALLNANVPPSARLSRQVPLTVARLIVASTCTGVEPGVTTIASPIPIVPFGFANATPVADARVAAPHWSS